MPQLASRPHVGREIPRSDRYCRELIGGEFPVIQGRSGVSSVLSVVRCRSGDRRSEVQILSARPLRIPASVGILAVLVWVAAVKAMTCGLSHPALRVCCGDEAILDVSFGCRGGCRLRW